MACPVLQPVELSVQPADVASWLRGIRLLLQEPPLAVDLIDPPTDPPPVHGRHDPEQGIDHPDQRDEQHQDPPEGRGEPEGEKALEEWPPRSIELAGRVAQR